MEHDNHPTTRVKRALSESRTNNSTPDLSGLPLVISIHGIRTRGEWQKELTRSLNRAGILYDPYDYGFYSAVLLRRGKSREKQLEKFLNSYTNTRGIFSEKVPSVVAHSFGSYIVAKSLELYPEVKIDKLILCGSIVNRKFNWGHYIENGQVGQVLHQYGKKDFWPELVCLLVPDGGPSGRRGFKNNSRIVEQENKNFGHSSYFYELNYRKNWVPFFHTGDTSHIVNPASPTNIWYRFMTWIIALVSAILLWMYFPLRGLLSWLLDLCR